MRSAPSRSPDDRLVNDRRRRDDPVAARQGVDDLRLVGVGDGYTVERDALPQFAEGKAGVPSPVVLKDRLHVREVRLGLPVAEHLSGLPVAQRVAAVEQRPRAKVGAGLLRDAEQLGHDVGRWRGHAISRILVMGPAHPQLLRWWQMAGPEST